MHIDDSYNPDLRLGLLAGGGPLPIQIKQAAQANPGGVYTLGIANAFAPELQPDAICGIGQAAKISRLMKQNGCRQLVIIGGVRRPNLSTLAVDRGGIELLGRILMQKARGDNALLALVSDYFTRQGFTLIAAQDILPELTASEGVLTNNRPSTQMQADIQLGIEATRQLGALDIGQSSVVCRGQVLAVEDVAGTDALLQRVAEFPAEWRGTEKNRAGVLVKLPKPGQERRIDLPTLGVQTITNAARAGLAGIVFEAQGALLNDIQACIDAANAADMFLLGIAPAPDESVDKNHDGK